MLTRGLRRRRLTDEDVISHGRDLAFTTLEGATVLMSVRSGKYYKLDDIGSHVWRLIEAPQTVATVCERLADEFHVDPATCRRDVHALLDRLLRDRLIRVEPRT